MTDYTRNKNIITERCFKECDTKKNKHGLCDDCKCEFMVFDSINKAKKKSRDLQSSGHHISLAATN